MSKTPVPTNVFNNTKLIPLALIFVAIIGVLMLVLGQSLVSEDGTIRFATGNNPITEAEAEAIRVEVRSTDRQNQAIDGAYEAQAPRVAQAIADAEVAVAASNTNATIAQNNAFTWMNYVGVFFLMAAALGSVRWGKDHIPAWLAILRRRKEVQYVATKEGSIVVWTNPKREEEGQAPFMTHEDMPGVVLTPPDTGGQLTSADIQAVIAASQATANRKNGKHQGLDIAGMLAEQIQNARTGANAIITQRSNAPTIINQDPD